MSTYFSDRFGVEPAALKKYGAFNVSIVTDLPLFIDPFLLFNSKKAKYKELHESIIEYLIFLRDKAQLGPIDEGLLRAWYCFPEVEQNWLGFSQSGNAGHGLGIDFARAPPEPSYLVCRPRLRADHERNAPRKSVPDPRWCRSGQHQRLRHEFDQGYLCSYTQEFALSHIDAASLRAIPVSGAGFNYETETWETATYTLPWSEGDFVLLTPKDLLTRDENWINRPFGILKVFQLRFPMLSCAHRSPTISRDCFPDQDEELRHRKRET
jgi:hypothetical protein